MSRLYSLFVKHMRTLYNGEKMMAAAIHTFGQTASSEQLRRFFVMKEAEKEKVLKIHREIFHELHANSDGEIDPVINSVVNPADEHSDPQKNALLIATIMYSDDMHMYWVNAYSSAISCAEDLAMFEIAELLQRCLDSTDFVRVDFELLAQQETSATEAA